MGTSDLFQQRDHVGQANLEEAPGTFKEGVSAEHIAGMLVEHEEEHHKVFFIAFAGSVLVGRTSLR